MKKIVDYYMANFEYYPEDIKPKLTDDDYVRMKDLVSRYGEEVILHKMYWYVNDNSKNLLETSIPVFSEYCEIGDHRVSPPIYDEDLICRWIWDEKNSKYYRVMDFKKIPEEEDDYIEN